MAAHQPAQAEPPDQNRPGKVRPSVRSGRPGGGGPPAPTARPVVVALVLGALLAAAKTAVVGSYDLDARETLAFMAGLVIAAVALGMAAGRRGILTTAGLRTPGPWRRAAPPPLLGLVAVLAAAVALSDAGPSEAARIVVATALGEEILFRGVVYGLAATVSHRAAMVVSSVTFGAWHLVDAVQATSSEWPMPASVAFVAGVVLLTGLAGALLFAPLRRRTGAIYASALVHAGLNLAGTLLSAG